MELPNKEKIRTFGEKETYKYLGIMRIHEVCIPETTFTDDMCQEKKDKK